MCLSPLYDDDLLGRLTLELDDKILILIATICAMIYQVESSAAEPSGKIISLSESFLLRTLINSMTPAELLIFRDCPLNVA